MPTNYGFKKKQKIAFFRNIYAKNYIYVSIFGSIRHICRCCNTDGVEVRCKSHKKSGINTGPREHSELF